ncbi:MAG: ATP-binding protein [Treponema sp.]|nr:ATP-binding protein [Treponema sp.]
MATQTVPATDANIEAVNNFIHGQLPETCPPGLLNQIDLAVEEIYVNIAHYAYAPATGNVTIDCTVEGEPPVITITFTDSGRQFDPLAKKDPDITLSAEERDIGGLGIFLTKKCMDSVSYRWENNQNKLTISKKLAK